MRLFVAVLLSEPMRQALLDTMAQMRAQGARGNFTRKENLHVTLAFLGETDAQGCVRAKRALDACAASCAPFSECFVIIAFPWHKFNQQGDFSHFPEEENMLRAARQERR